MGLVIVVCGILSSAVTLVIHHRDVTAENVTPLVDSACGFTDPLPTLTVEVTVKMSQVYYPQVVNRITATVPPSWSHAGDLTMSPNDEQFKRAVRCVLGRKAHEVRTEEKRDSPPSIRLENGQIVVRDMVRADVIEPNTDLSVGFTRVVATSPKSWDVWVNPPPLPGPHLSSIRVSTPKGWLAQPRPYPLVRYSSSEAVWDVATLAGGGASFNLLPNTETTVSMLAFSFPWSLTRTAMWWLTLLLTGGLLFHSVQVLRQDPSLWDAATTRLADATRRAAVGVLVLTTALITTDVLENVLKGMAPGVNLETTYYYECLLLVLAVTIASILWGTRLAWVLALAGACLTIWAVLPTLTNWNWVEVQPRLNGRAVAGFQFALAFLYTVLYLAGLGHGVRSTVPAVERRFTKHQCWEFAIAIAGAVVAERIVMLAMDSTTGREFTTGLVDGSSLCCSLSWYPQSIVAATVWQILPIVGLGLVALLVRSARNADLALPVSQRRIAVVAFFALSCSIESVVFEWYVPLWVAPLLLARRLVVSMRSPLDRKMPVSGEPVRHAVQRMTIERLREEVLSWRTLVREGTALERALLEGNLNAAAYTERAAALTRERQSHRRFRLPFLATVNRLGPAPDQRLVLPESLTPVDIILAVGPSKSPAENARIAAGIAGSLGLVASVLRVSVDTSINPPWPLGSWLSPLLSIGATIVSNVASWICVSAVIGLLWQHLPGRRGPLKVLPFIVTYVILQVSTWGLTLAVDGVVDLMPLLEAAIFTVVTSTLALAMDLRAVTTLRSPWRDPKVVFLAAYGVENPLGQLTFILAQVAAIAAIISFLAGGETPSYPSIDPFNANIR